jgi:hypothetical protein
VSWSAWQLTARNMPFPHIIDVLAAAGVLQNHRPAAVDVEPPLATAPRQSSTRRRRALGHRLGAASMGWRGPIRLPAPAAGTNKTSPRHARYAATWSGRESSAILRSGIDSSILSLTTASMAR